ncbi:hypothetical protein [Brevibacterium sp. UMB1308A]|nr:hypothetical protein [Brevibacterium sp. UMB1308A]MDK8346770.1 hypothetical protein [Brevibacterium sp. UMB1308B]
MFGHGGAARQQKRHVLRVGAAVLAAWEGLPEGRPAVLPPT